MGFTYRDKLSPFVGRSAELRLLGDAWEAVRQGRGQTLLLVGDRGDGQVTAGTRVPSAWSAVSRMSSSSVVLALSPRYRVALDHRGHRPLAPARAEHPAGERLAALKTSLPNPSDASVVPLLAQLLSVPPDLCEPLPPFGPQKMRERTLDAVREWLLARTKESQLLFVLEDVHWADPTTLEPDLRLAPDGLPGALVLLTSRAPLDANSSEELIPTLRLGPLTKAEISAILEHLAPHYSLTRTLSNKSSTARRASRSSPKSSAARSLPAEGRSRCPIAW